MKIRIKNSIKCFLFIFPILLAATFCITGCDTSKTLWAKFWFSGGTAPKPAPDPLADWKFKSFPGWGVDPNGHNNNVLDKAITDDYQDFIAKNNLDLFGAITGFFEDGTGQHAFEFTAFPPGQNATWNYVLIYDKENKRIKVIKYNYTKYQS
jgi:hypothetical protein